jgi:uncharacterized protein YecT (DUF1311 family)
MISFNKTPGFLGTIILTTVALSCSSCQLSQGILSQSSQKSVTALNLSTEPAQATSVTSTAVQTCWNSETQTTKCDQLDNLKSTKRLEEVYQKLVSGLGGASREKLIKSQLAWATFVEAQCSFETRGFDDSTSSSSVRSHCLDDMSQQRIQALQRYLISNQ